MTDRPLLENHAAKRGLASFQDVRGNAAKREGKPMSLKIILKSTAAAVIVAASMTAAMAANIAVIGGSTDDAFWNKIKKGLDDATPGVVANGGSVNYLRLVNYDNFAPDVVQLIRTAISMDVDGLVIPNWVPEAEDPAIKDAIAAGIKVILMNAGGADKARELGAINYVGSEEYVAGQAGGEYFADHGQKNVLCVNTLPGTANIEARCKGIDRRRWPPRAASPSNCRCPRPRSAMRPRSPKPSRRRCCRTRPSMA